jgi:two-component system alkaline phosphatase synthesis response regulator PhoP
MLDPAPIRILVVDDDREACSLIAECLEPDYEVVTTFDVGQALELCRRQRFHLALLDVRMPGMSGLDLARSLADLAPQMGIMLITAYAAVPDAVRALRDLGALDYVQKPFAPRELRRRVAEALRQVDQDRRLQLGDLTLHLHDRLVERDGEALSLTRQEFAMLLTIARGGGRIVLYEELLRDVWECEAGMGNPDFARSAMSRLRRKLGDNAAEPRYVETVRGVGYRAVTAREQDISSQRT